jgi:hypothetical protein
MIFSKFADASQAYPAPALPRLYTDMCPFRAIDATRLKSSVEETYGWNLGMQMKVARRAANPRNSSNPSSTHWWGIESLRHIARDICRRCPHYRDALVHRDRKEATDEH